jgi:putative FmdB family regulatory protein
MPMFDFECTKCAHAFEEIIPSSAPPPACPECGGATEKLLSIGQFKVKKMSKKGEQYLSKENQAVLRADNRRKGLLFPE